MAEVAVEAPAEAPTEAPAKAPMEVTTTMGSKCFLNSRISSSIISCTIFATFTLQLDLNTDTCRGHDTTSKLPTDSAEIVEAKEIENHVSPIIYCWSLQQPPWRTTGMLIIKIVFNHEPSFKKNNWLLDCSLKQPPAASRSAKQFPWGLGAMESPIKISEIIMTN